MAKNEILFGTGDLFIVTEEDDGSGSTTEVETKVGESNGEASLNFEYEFTDVNGGASNQTLASFKTSETVLFNAGLVTYDLKTISEFMAGEFTEDTTAGTRTFGVGGSYTVPIKRLRFVHTKKQDGKTITLEMFKAQNQTGLEWTFNNEEATAFEFEFKLLADPSKSNGNIVQIIEEIEATG